MSELNGCHRFSNLIQSGALDAYFGMSINVELVDISEIN